MNAINYDEVYENWDSLPDGKISLAGEGLWVKRLPNGDVALNNNPLDENYRWQDVVRNGKVIHRRWNTMIWFFYEPASDDGKTINEEKDKERRRAIGDAIKPIGNPNFFWAGRGYALMLSEDDAACREQLVAALDKVDIPTDVQPLWHMRGEPEPESDDTSGGVAESG